MSRSVLPIFNGETPRSGSSSPMTRVHPYLGPDAPRVRLAGSPAAAVNAPERAAALTVSLPIPLHHRATLVLRAIACAPRSSKREIAAAVGISDNWQTSHLPRGLSRLPRELAATKRISMRGPVVPAPVTSVHPCRGLWLRLGGTVASDSPSGISRMRPQAPIAHYSAGRKGVDK
jgi:hypothetical protein